MGEIRRVGVVGSGLMGSGIAEVCARAGLDVLVGELSEKAAQAGKNRVVKSLHRAVQAGKLTAADTVTLSLFGITEAVIVQATGTSRSVPRCGRSWL